MSNALVQVSGLNSIIPDIIPEICHDVPFMSSLEIAAMVGERHGNVMAVIRRELEKIGEAELKFQSSYRDSSGKSNICYCLPGEYLLFIASTYDAKLRMQIIRHWSALNNGTTRPVMDAANVFVGHLVNGGRKARMLELKEAEQRALLSGTSLTAKQRRLITLP